MKTIFSLLALMTFAAAGAQTMKVATYNIRYATESDGVNAWSNRAEAVRGLVGFHGFDIFGTQEGLRHQLEELTADGEYSFTGVGRDDGERQGEHSAIVYRTDRFELLDGGTFWLSETPDVPSFGWDAQSHRRICTWARFLDRQTGGRFWFFSAHYDHIAVRAPVESSRLVLERIEQMSGGEPVIFVGDMNSTPDSEAVRLVAEKLQDSFTAPEVVPYGPRRTYNGFSTTPVEPTDRIDHIFTSRGAEVLRCGVLTDIAGFDPVRFPSDHFPVVAELKFTR